MLMDIGASFLKWKKKRYDEEPFDNHISDIEKLLFLMKNDDEPIYIATQAGAFIDPKGNIHNWGYQPTAEDIPLEKWLREQPNVKFVGLDYQMAVHGADLHEGEVLVNLGTGGQVTQLLTDKEIHLEQYYIGSTQYRAVRFIPCGKILSKIHIALNYMSMWDYLSQLSLDALMLNNNGLICNPAWHPAQKGYPGGLYGITLENFTPERIVNAALMGILWRFTAAIHLLDNHPTKYKLAGGLAEKLPVVREYFEQYHVPVEMIPHATFRGLERIQKEMKV